MLISISKQVLTAAVFTSKCKFLLQQLLLLPVLLLKSLPLLASDPIPSLHVHNTMHKMWLLLPKIFSTCKNVMCNKSMHYACNCHIIIFYHIFSRKILVVQTLTNLSVILEDIYWCQVSPGLVTNY